MNRSRRKTDAGKRKTDDGERKTGLTHLDVAGRIRMVDVGGKPATAREAIARGRIAISAAAMKQIRAGGMKKGDPLETARLAGIMAAKQTSSLIPLCHPLPLSHADVRLTAVRGGYEIEAGGRAPGSPRRPMEALTPGAGPAPPIFDHGHAIDDSICIGGN